jgi:hypothetical protein
MIVPVSYLGLLLCGFGFGVGRVPRGLEPSTFLSYFLEMVHGTVFKLGFDAYDYALLLFLDC